MFAAPASFAEETKIGTAVQLARETDVRKEPSEEAGSYGILPEGTVLTLRGEREGEFLAIRVELEDGVLEGWISRDAIARDSFDNLDEPLPKRKRPRRQDEEEVERPTLRPRSKLRIPKDEGLLLRRESSFLYGLHAGALFVIMEDDAGTQYLGPGGEVGGHVGLFLAQNLEVRIEAGYFIVNGQSQDTSAPGGGGAGTPAANVSTITFGFADIGAAIQYDIDYFEMFARLKYSFGLSLSELPSTINVAGAADLSSLWVLGGIGYRIPISEVVDLSLRAQWGLSFLRSPVGISGGGLSIALGFKG